MLATALFTATLANAAEPSPAAASSEHRLTPEQIQKVLDDAARKRASADRPESTAGPEAHAVPTPVHGEIGFSIGTGGYRSAYGTAIIGLPGDGTATLSIGTQRLPDYQFYPYE